MFSPIHFLQPLRSSLLLLFVTTQLFTPTVVMAGYDNSISLPDSANIPGGENLVGRIRTIVNSFLTVLAIAAVIYIIVSGIWYITSAGDEEQAARGKRGLLYGVIGILIVLLSYALFSFIVGSVVNDNSGPGNVIIK